MPPSAITFLLSDCSHQLYRRSTKKIHSADTQAEIRLTANSVNLPYKCPLPL